MKDKKSARKIWRFLSAMLCVCMLVALLPSAGLTFATDEDTESVTASESQEMTSKLSSENVSSDVVGKKPKPTPTPTPTPTPSVSNRQKLLNIQTEATAKVFLLYENVIPDDINQGFATELFGPSGNDTPYFEVTVDLVKLMHVLDVNGNATSQEDTNIDVYFSGDYWYISYQSGNTTYTAEELWSKILKCMSDEDAAKFEEFFAGDYVGYVLKRESSTHIDGVLKVNPPFYFTEASIDDTVIDTFQRSGETNSYTNTEGTPFSSIKSAYETKLRDIYGSDITITWPSASAMASAYGNQGISAGSTFSTTGTIEKPNGEQYRFTFSGNTLDYTAYSSQSKWYPNYTEKSLNTYYVSAYHLTVDRAPVVVTKTFSGVSALPEEFTISVGDYEQDLEDAAYASGTYTWVFNGLRVGTEYTVEESNYSVANMTDTSTVSLNGSAASAGTSTTVAVTKGSNTVAFTNTYASSVADLTVTKTFSGISADMIPEDFAVSVGSTEKTLDDAASVSSDGLTYTWLFEDLTIGSTYSVSESGYEIDCYDCETSGTGNVTITDSANRADIANAYTYQNGTLTITKNISGKLDYAGAPTFIFKIETYSDAALTNLTAIRYVSLRMTDASESVTLSNLPRGYYKVSEFKSLGYDLNGVTAGAFTAVSGNYSISTLGYMTQEGIGSAAAVTFGNGLTDLTKLIDTDSVSNSYSVKISGGSVTSITQNTPSGGNDNLDNSAVKPFSEVSRP